MKPGKHSRNVFSFNRAVPTSLYLIALTGFLILSCGKEEEKVTEEVIRPVKVMNIATGTDVLERKFSGKVRATQQVDLSFKVSGPLIKLLFEEGKAVKEGALIARIDPRDFETRLKGIKSSLSEASANLKAMKKGARPEDIKVLESEVDAAQANYLAAEAQYKRYKQLWEKRYVAKADFDRYARNWDVTKAKLAAARQNLEKGKKGARKEDIEAMQSKIRGLEAQQKAAQDALDDTYLKAPFSGVIAKKYVDNFQDVRAKQAIVSLQDISHVDILVDIPESLMAQLKGEGKADVFAQFAASPDKKYKLSLKEYSTEADPGTQTYRVVMTMPAPGDINILPGMTATVSGSKTGVGSTRIVIPAIAVFADENGDSNVWIINKETMIVQRRKVTSGELTGKDNIEIVDGLKPGEMIAVAGVSRLREDMKVRPLAE